MNKFNYENTQYLKKLDDLDESYYSKYIKFIEKFSGSKKAFILDVGCGNGAVLSVLKKNGYKNQYGVDISKLFIIEAKSKGLKNVYSYNGSKFPFRKDFFDIIGSFNVLEHTENPENFIFQQLRILKQDGYLIVSCPNFLSVLFYNQHRKLRGIKNKFKNFLTVVKKIIYPDVKFDKMKPLIRKKFEYDDDAIVVTNILDLRQILKNNDCRVVYESGFINYDTFFYRLINRLPLVRYLLPSCFVVAQKK